MEYGQLYHVYLNSTFLRQIPYKYLANNSLTPLTFPVLRKVPLFPAPPPLATFALLQSAVGVGVAVTFA